MIEWRERQAAACATILVFCALGWAPRLFSQNTPQDLIQQIGWEIDTGRIDAALAHARQGVEQYPSSSILMHLLGVAESKKGLQDKARQSFLSAIRLDPTIPQNYYDVAVLDLQSNRYAEATTMLETYLRVNPQNGKAHLLLGLAYRTQKQPVLAIAQFKQALALSPDLPMAHYYLGTAYEDQGNPKAALEEFKKELKTNPRFYDAYWQAGNIELTLQDFKAAEAFFRQGISLRPLHYEAYYGLAKLFLARQEFPQAASQLETVIALEPQDIDAHSLLAHVYEKMGKTMDAKREDLVVETLRAGSEVSDAGDSSH